MGIGVALVQLFDGRGWSAHEYIGVVNGPQERPQNWISLHCSLFLSLPCVIVPECHRTV
jgi:hypothetical protein